MVDREFDEASNRIVEDNASLQNKILSVMILAAIVNMCLCCCFCPYAAHLIRRQRQQETDQESDLTAK